MSWENQIFLKRCTQLRPHLGSSHFILFCFKYLSFGTSFLSWAFLWKAALIFHWGSYSFLLEFTRKSVLWWNKSSLEFSYRHREHCHWWWFWKKTEYFRPRIWRFDSLSAISQKLQDWNSHLDHCFEFIHWNGAHHVTNIVQFCRSYRIKEPTY